jgi:hypothetical protein
MFLGNKWNISQKGAGDGRGPTTRTLLDFTLAPCCALADSNRNFVQGCASSCEHSAPLAQSAGAMNALQLREHLGKWSYEKCRRS